MNNEQPKGPIIMELFNSMRQLFRDISLIINKFDECFTDKGYKVRGGSGITKDNSQSLYDPERWLLEGIYRLYYKEDNVIYGFNISFRRGNTEPLMIAGKITYNSKGMVSEWDLWDIWYDSENTMSPGDNDLKEIHNERIITCKIFAIPLVQLTGNDKIQVIAKRIIDL